MENLYRIEELCTTGWELLSEDEVQLTKEMCNQRLQHYLNEGMSHNAIGPLTDPFAHKDYRVYYTVQEHFHSLWQSLSHHSHLTFEVQREEYQFHVHSDSFVFQS